MSECKHVHTRFNEIGLLDCLDCGGKEIDFEPIFPAPPAEQGRERAVEAWVPVRCAADMPSDGAWLVTVEFATGGRDVEARWGHLIYERGGARVVAYMPLPEAYKDAE